MEDYDEAKRCKIKIETQNSDKGLFHLEQQKQIGNLIPKVGDTINNTHNIKQKFNINIFLNEQCKDAINMNDFIQQLQLTLNNLDTTKSKGLTDGLTIEHYLRANQYSSACIEEVIFPSFAAIQ